VAEIKPTVKLGKEFLPSLRDLCKFLNLRLVVKESLRLCPPAKNLMTRVNVENARLDSTVFPPGTRFITNLGLLNFNQTRLQRPLDFLPTRHDANSRLNSFEFGGGDRLCKLGSKDQIRYSPMYILYKV
jgi:cytochrome P450